MKNYKRIFLIRNILKFISFSLLIVAFLGLSWGTNLVPVQKASVSVAMVFDVSNSMNAKDCQGGKSRLEAASIYAEKLLQKIQEIGRINVSIILAKGDGINVIPLTEDYEIIYSLLNTINSSLVSVPGTSLGKGIIAARNSFSPDFSSANKIWLFTDGEETDNLLAGSMEDCIKSGIPLSIIGFGSESESEILAGDGKTKIKSALRKERLLSAIESAEKKYPYYVSQSKILYVDAVEKGSAIKLLNQLMPSSNGIGEKSDFMSYEAQKVPRFKIFLVIAILLYILSFIITEFDISSLSSKKQSKDKKYNKKIAQILCIFLVITIFTGCNGKNNFNEKTVILNGVNAFQHKKYNQAISAFIQVEDYAKEKKNQQLYDYALFDLAASYAMQNEDEAAAKKYSEISSDAPASILYGAFYNSGIVAYRNGNLEEAADLFRKALEIDSTKIEAKVNMEISVNQIEIKSRQNESKLTATQEDNSEYNDEESSIFEHIKENDKNQWKSIKIESDQNLAEDY